MAEKPDFILNFQRPKNTEIKKIGNNWYLYERFNKYDPEIKRSRKVSGKCLGKITPEGLVPTRRRLTPVAQLPAEPADTVEAGATVFLWRRTTNLRERLQKHFPDMWRPIYVIALLRLLKDPRFKRLQMHYEYSLLSHVLPGQSFSASSNAALLKNLGARREAIRNFMHEDVARKSVFIMFDGHRLVTSSKTMPFAELGYDSKRRYMPKINLLYIYSLGDGYGSPVYYKQFVGSTPDVAAFSNMLEESGITNTDCTIIADKGFASEADFELLQDRDLKYVIPIRRGNRFVKPLLPLNPRSYQDLFTYNGRAIQALRIDDEGFSVFVYFDAQLYANELADATERGEKLNGTLELKCNREMERRSKGQGRLTDEELEQIEPRNLTEVHDNIPEMGTVTIRTNRTELNSEQVYRIYKQRQNIEQFFRTYGMTLDFDASYMRNQTSQEAWLFLNHLSSMMGMDCITSIAEIGEDKTISLEDLKQSLGKIMVSKLKDQWLVSPIKRSVEKIIEKLNFEVTAKEIAAIVAEGMPAEGQRT